MGDLSENFSKREFACKDGCDRDGDMTKEFLFRAELMRAGIANFYGYPRAIICTNAIPGRNGGNRCPSLNKRVGGAPDSDHEDYPGVVEDCFVDGMSTRELAWWAKWAGFNAIGIYGGNIHMGLRGPIGKRRMHQWGTYARQYRAPVRVDHEGV
jgi:hypothetical protein